MPLSTWRFLTVLGLIVTTSAGLHVMGGRNPDRLERPLEQLPLQLGTWTGSGSESLDGHTLETLRASSYLLRSYRKPHAALQLFIAYYAQQRAGETMHSPRHCLPGSGWEIWGHGSETVWIGGRSTGINAYRIQNGLNRLLVLYWYQSRKRIIANEYLAKMFLVGDSLRYGFDSGAIVRITVADQPADVAGGLEFASVLIPEVQRCLGAIKN